MVVKMCAIDKIQIYKACEILRPLKLSFTPASLVAQTIKNLPAMQETRI